jgi:hypothetical protein
VGGEVVLIMNPPDSKSPPLAKPPTGKAVPQPTAVKPGAAKTVAAKPATGKIPAKSAPAKAPPTGKGGKPLPVKASTPRKKSFLGLGWLLADEMPRQSAVINEKTEIARYKRLVSMVRWQAIMIGMLACIIILGAPVVQVVYKYHAVNPHHDMRDLSPLTGPNLTNDAVISWATDSVVEVMTLGFGDFDHQIFSQYDRFTPDGWTSFTKAIRDMDLRTTFKDRQLVLTTVPRDAAVITAQGENADHEYEWYIQLPVIMTYTTNNNVSQKQRGNASLTIVRVPASQNIAGIGIKRWSLN